MLLWAQSYTSVTLILFQSLVNRFHNSILFQYFQYRVENLKNSSQRRAWKRPGRDYLDRFGSKLLRGRWLAPITTALAHRLLGFFICFAADSLHGGRDWGIRALNVSHAAGRRVFQTMLTGMSRWQRFYWLRVVTLHCTNKYMSVNNSSQRTLFAWLQRPATRSSCDTSNIRYIGPVGPKQALLGSLREEVSLRVQICFREELEKIWVKKNLYFSIVYTTRKNPHSQVGSALNVCRYTRTSCFNCTDGCCYKYVSLVHNRLLLLHSR